MIPNSHDHQRQKVIYMVSEISRYDEIVPFLQEFGVDYFFMHIWRGEDARQCTGQDVDIAVELVGFSDTEMTQDQYVTLADAERLNRVFGIPFNEQQGA